MVRVEFKPRWGAEEGLTNVCQNIRTLEARVLRCTFPLTGQLLCFVHADNRPPSSLVAAARQTLSDGRTLMGGFRVIVEHQGRTLRWMTFHQLIKTYYAPLLFRPLSFARSHFLNQH